MTELHDAFSAWLVSGALDSLPRDVALHASACPECLRAVAAFDALSAVDPGAAPMPMLRAGRARTGLTAAPDGRAVTALVAVAAVVAAGFIALNGVRPSTETTALATETPREDVLGGLSSPPPTPEASASSTPSASAIPTATPTPTPAEQSNPPMGGGPPPIATPRPTITPGEPTPTVRATASASATPTSSATPTPTEIPTPTPTPTESPTPTPTPTVTPTPTPETPAP
jgi:hypothetical protein